MDRITGQWLPASDRQADGEFISLSDITGFLRLYARSIAGCVGIGILGAAFYAATTDRVYTATTQILIEPKLPQMLQQQATEVNLSLDTAQVESQLAVMRSEKIALMVIDELKLLDNETFNRHGPTFVGRFGKFAAIVGEALGLGTVESSRGEPTLVDGAVPENGTVSEDEAFERRRNTMWIFQKGLDVRRQGVSYAVDISFSSPDPDMAAKIANTTANAHIREQLETKAAAAREGGTWLEQRLGELRTQMNTATQVAQEFRSRHDYSVSRHAGQTEIDGEEVDNWDAAAEIEGPTLEELEVTADTYRKLYESFLQAYTSSVSRQSYPVADARIITPASRPLFASHPRRKLVVTFGALFGAMAGIGIAFLRHTLDRTVRSPKQIRDEFGLHCIGELPPTGKLFHSEVAKRPQSGFSEGLRRAMTVISFSDTSRPVRILGITSALPGDGKSTCAGNLAMLYSMQGFRTLLFDADIVHSALTTHLRPPTVKHPATADIRAHISPSANGWFDILPSTVLIARKLLSAKVMEEGLLPLLRSYDMVVVDLPPLSAGSEKLAVSSLFDGIIVTAAWGKTPLDALGELVGTLHAVKAPLIGVLLTNVRYISTKRSNNRARQIPS
jgi:uncharacterized protein involved in exopolysaccharide biosynthesis/Mrp family chromosome partitioning ATPase